MTKKIIFTALALMLTFGLTFAQAPTGKIVGTVTDDQGAPLPGVSVTCDSTRLVGVATAVTDESGTYRIFSLPSGTYNVRFNLPGFKTVTRREIIVQLEQTITLNIKMEQSALAEEVTVVGQSPLIDVKSTVKGSTMTKDVFMQLPRSRDFTGLLSTVPGVQYEGNQGGLSVDGASGTENTFYIDGTNITNIHVGLQSQSIVMEQLDEVKVTASGYPAEFGGSMGGVVNVISRSGGNEFHGDLFFYYNNNSLLMQGHDRDGIRVNPYAGLPYTYDEVEYVSNDNIYWNGGKDRDEYSRYEGVINLGGYIFKDKLWFFGSFNPTYAWTDYQPRWFTVDPVDLSKAKVPGDTIADPRQGRQTYDGFYNKNWYYYWQAKITAAPFKGLRMALSTNNNFSKYRGSAPSIAGTSTKYYSYSSSWNPINPSTGLGLLTAGKEPGFSYPNWSANANIDYTVSNNFLINMRGGFFHTNTRDQVLKVPGTYYGFSGSTYSYPEIVANRPDLLHYSGWSNGAGTTVYKKAIYERASANLDLTYYASLAGEHAFKAGVQWIRLHEDMERGPEAPLVSLYWGQTSYDIPGVTIGKQAYDAGDPHGQYGYYIIRNDFKSLYGWVWNIASNNWAVYLQDSWTIGQKLTINLGVRNESEYVPSLATNDPVYKDYKPIQFGFLSSNDAKSFSDRFFEKFAPRLGLVYDVFGDSSLKVFGSFGVYYDVMKLYMAEGAYGGFKWWSSYYSLDNYDFEKIAASGDVNNAADQAAGGKYYGSRNWRTTSWDYTDPQLKPVSQSEVTFGAEKKLTEELSFSARLVYKHLIRTIEDVGVLMQDEAGNWSEQYYIGNPGEGWTQTKGTGTGRFDPLYWPSPLPKREYWGLNLALEKRFSNNWQGGFNYTWSRMTGNYGGLSSSDEGGRNSPNVERYWDLWFERYDIHGNPLDGVLPSDRTHYFKLYGSYAFPFGLTAGVVAYGRSGLPRTTSLGFNNMQIFPDNYFDTGKRVPFLFNADLYLEYNLRIAKKYTINLNATIYNFTNTSTITSYYDRANYTMLYLSDTELLAQKTNYVPWKDYVQAKIQPGYQWHPYYMGDSTDYNNPHNMWTGRYGAWSARVGARLSF